jgi:hypothetical protein
MKRTLPLENRGIRAEALTDEARVLGRSNWKGETPQPVMGNHLPGCNDIAFL